MLHDPRVHKLADILVNYSTRVKKGDVVSISGPETAKPLILEIYREALKKHPKEIVIHTSFEEMQEILYSTASPSQLKQFPDVAMDIVKKTDVWIGIIAPNNTRNLSGIDPKQISLHQKTLQPLLNHRVEHTRWVLTAFPTMGQAQEADMSIEAFTDFIFSTMIDVDWAGMIKKQSQLAKRFEQSSIVRIVGEDTDLSLSIKGRKVVADNGEANMPGGEVFTSVVENSAEGYIHYTYPAIYGGNEVDSVKLWFEKGKVIKAQAKKGEKFLHHMLEMDAGARYIGELGIGNNFKINKFIKSILFDEKIGGSVHLALGRSYTETLGKNESALHWDMIKDLRMGGELYLDGTMVQKDGRWLI